ncbi:MAG: histidine phosphatase family protein [Candidatus Limnocylindrales bacterium]|nr:histidine phosphatase family protein [Candidatus Limnocylindrales bacterium]
MTGERGTALPLPVPPDLDASLVLLRHGQSVWLAEGRFQGRADTPLSPLGERQAALAGARLADPAAPPRLPVPAGDPVAIVHSPLARTAQTAAAVAAAIALRGRPAPPLVAEPGLIEIGQGAWEGHYQRDVESGWPAEIAGWRRDPVRTFAPGGESLVDVDRRVREALGGVIERLERARVAAPPADASGTAPGPTSASFYDPHAGPWIVLVGHDGAFKVALLALLGLPLDRFWTFTQTTTGIAVLDIRNGRAVLRAWNRTEHLAPLELEAGEAERRAEEEAAARARSGAL